MESSSNESKIILAIEALQRFKKLSVRTAAKIYGISETTIRHRRAARQPRRDAPANLRKLTDLEESVLVQYILDLAAKGFPPRLSVVGDIANRLHATRDAPSVGTRWASNFVKRRPELRTRLQVKQEKQASSGRKPREDAVATAARPDTTRAPVRL